MTSTSPLPPQQLLDDVTETASCPICSQLFDDPRLLPCSHTFCLGCIRRYVARQNPPNVFQQVVLPPPPRLSCPLCRHEFDVSADGLDRLPKNFIVDELTEKLRTAKLSPKEPTEASSGFPLLDSPAFTRMTQSEADLQLAIQLTEEENNFVPSTSDYNAYGIASDAMIAWALTADGVQEEWRRKRPRTAVAATNGSQGAAAAAGALSPWAQQAKSSTLAQTTANTSFVVIHQPSNNSTNVTDTAAGVTATNTNTGCCRCCCCCGCGRD